MAKPPSASAFLKALRDEGCKVVEHDGWRTHNRNHKGAWGPIHGVMIHHTVTKGSAATVKICRDGHSSLPGPLCHGVITKDGTIHLIGWGRANHAGLGDDDVLSAVIDERPFPADNEANTDGNARFIGFECENLGDGRDPWPAVQLEAIERASSAVCRLLGWNERSVIGHLEWQPGKVDPRGFTMASMRARVAERLKHPAGNAPAPNEEDPLAGMSKKDIADAVLNTDGVFGIPASWRTANPSNKEWKFSAVIVNLGDHVRAVEAKLDAQTKTIAELARAVAAQGQVDPDDLVQRIEAALERVTVRLDVTEESP